MMPLESFSVLLLPGGGVPEGGGVGTYINS
mgnify:CR=1 FL=1|jgi:hypothetical protein